MKGMRKVKRGKGFRGVLNYVFARDAGHKEEPGRLLGGNLSGTDPRTLAQEFGITRTLRPEIEKPVWHNSLRLPAGESVTDDQWLNIADEYMQEMGFSDLHPRCYVLHDDKDGQHIHIVASRIALDGSLYLGKNENLIST
ncbi:relaxase/mobilization nuclease domain-containing protein, partial [Acidithiobacillus thiooxidans]|uniref:relaxase/mobilization nuclease domain-containing protein n=1 Tax=Acidithiobacillus thiooxidans TaxID=930 RepID=UPI001C066CDD